MPTQELYHGTKGDSVLRILRERLIRPKDGQIFFCKQESQLHTLFVHGADVSRDAAFVIKVKVHIADHDQLKPRVTPGVSDTWVLASSTPVKAEIEALFIRPRPGQPVETVTGRTEINNRLQAMGRRVHPVFRLALGKILAELKRAGWQPYIDNISRTSAEQAEKMRQGYSRTMRSWHVETTIATLPHGSCALDVVHGNAADIVDARYKWAGPAASPDFQFWNDLGRIAKKHGCEWGGDWKRRDVAHVQMLFIEGAPHTTVTV
jgi:D-alanyl-D-alanine carboxypeptidase